MFLLFTKNAYLITTKITLDVYNCLYFLNAVQQLGDSLDVRRNLSAWCSMIDVVCIYQLILLYVTGMRIFWLHLLFTFVLLNEGISDVKIIYLVSIEQKKENCLHKSPVC